jgi:hypothetical protein
MDRMGGNDRVAIEDARLFASRELQKVSGNFTGKQLWFYF